MSKWHQSTFKSGHSNETAFVCVCDAIKLAFDKRMDTAIIITHIN